MAVVLVVAGAVVAGAVSAAAAAAVAVGFMSLLTRGDNKCLMNIFMQFQGWIFTVY